MSPSAAHFAASSATVRSTRVPRFSAMKLDDLLSLYFDPDDRLDAAQDLRALASLESKLREGASDKRRRRVELFLDYRIRDEGPKTPKLPTTDAERRLRDRIFADRKVGAQYARELFTALDAQGHLTPRESTVGGRILFDNTSPCDEAEQDVS